MHADQIPDHIRHTPPYRGRSNDDNGRSPSGRPKKSTFVPPRLIRASDFAGKPIPERDWLVPDIIPGANVTLLTGDGGTGKSLLALQLAIATVADIEWAGIGMVHEPGAAVYLSAEDDEPEVHRRLAGICTKKEVDLGWLSGLCIIPRAGIDAVLGVPAEGGTITATELHHAVVELTAPIRPRLIIVDNLADAFGGDEIKRTQTRQFVGLMRGWAISTGAAVVLLAHPSLAGIASGSGTSGSTAWSNSVRSRLYLDRPKADDGDQLDPDLRVLRHLKSNYSATGSEWMLRYSEGCFVANSLTAGGMDRLSAEAHADRVFMSMLSQFDREGRNVSAAPGTTFAPKAFVGHPGAAGVPKGSLAKAMNRLLAAGSIRVETTGPPSRQRSRLVIT